MKKNKDTASNTTSLAVPDYMNGKNGRGLQNITKEDQVLPKVILVQPLSPAKQDKGIPEGHLYNSLTGKDYGTSIEVTPIMTSKGRVCFQERELGGGVLCASDDNVNPRSMSEAVKTIAIIKKYKKGKDPKISGCDECPLKDWNDDGKTVKERAPRCSQFVAFAVLIAGESRPVAISMDRSKMKIAKKWMSMMVQAGDNLDIFARKYKLFVKTEKSDKNTFYNYDVEPIGFTSEKEFKKAEGLYESFKNVKASTPEA